MLGRILVTANCHAKLSLHVHIGGLEQGYLLSCTRFISPSSVQLLSTLTHQQHYFSQHYDVRHTSVFHHHPSSHARHPWTSTQGLTVSCCHASSVSSPPEGEPGWLKQRWIKFKTIIKAFVAGSKALYSDVKKMRQIQSKHKGRQMVLGQPPRGTSTGQLDFPLTREELFFITKTKKELWRMLPTVVLFWIPFLGYFVPLVAFMFPHLLLSPHFLMEQQRTELTSSKHQKVLTKTKAFSDDLKKREDSEKLAFLYKASDMFINSQVSDDVILTSGGSPTLKNINMENMSGLLDVWGMRSWIPFTATRQRRKLTNQMRYLYTSDWLMKQEGGVEILSPEALVEVCCERRLDVDLNSTEDMRNKLNVWMRISTSFQAECPEFILAHLPAAQYFKNETNKQ